MIIPLGHRVKSKIANDFRKLATERLKICLMLKKTNKSIEEIAKKGGKIDE